MIRDVNVRSRSVAVALFAVGLALALPVAGNAQVATTLEQAQVAGLSAEKKAEVQQRLARGGQTVYEILKTILLNSIQLKHPGARIVAMDFNVGIATLDVAGKMETVNFDPTLLTIR